LGRVGFGEAIFDKILKTLLGMFNGARRTCFMKKTEDNKNFV
jgi:hypothetical protein